MTDEERIVAARITDAHPVQDHVDQQKVTKQLQDVPKSDEEFKLFVATVYGEAGGQSDVAWKGVASVIMNRINNGHFKHGPDGAQVRYKSTTEVIKKTGFDAYTKRNPSFKKALFWQDNPPPDVDIPKSFRKLIDSIRPIYYEHRVTTSAILYYSPKAQHQNHIDNPAEYPEVPRWNFHEIFLLNIGLKDSDDFRFYKYK